MTLTKLEQDYLFAVLENMDHDEKRAQRIHDRLMRRLKKAGAVPYAAELAVSDMGHCTICNETATEWPFGVPRCQLHG